MKFSFDSLQICCNDFTPAADPIETHANVALLPTSCGLIKGDSIVDGTVAGIYEFPWMALIAHRSGDVQLQCYTNIMYFPIREDYQFGCIFLFYTRTRAFIN